MTTLSPSVLSIKDLSMAYSNQTVIDSLSLHLEEGQIGCLIGPSGCGKTSVLRTIAGFEQPHTGTISIAGQTVSSRGKLVAPAKRSIGMVFQDYALFPHLNVYDNVAFGLRNIDKKNRKARVMEMLNLVDLALLKESFPHKLSGGQQQRVALARALAMQPRLLLMDEPFSNLDVSLRERLSVEVRQILKKSGTTTLFVTHNQQEAFTVADKIGVMKNGAICQWASPFSLYHEPVSPYVASFIGEGRMIEGTVIEDNRIQTGLGRFLLPKHFRNNPTGKQLTMLIRPEDIIHDHSSTLQAEILQRSFRGASIMYELRLKQGVIVQALVPSNCDHKPGEWIGIHAKPGHVVLFDNC